MLLLLLTFQGDAGPIGLMGAPGPKGEKGDSVSQRLLFYIDGPHGWCRKPSVPTWIQPGHIDQQMWTDSLVNADTKCIQFVG